MALKEYWMGSVGPLLYDDEDTYEDGETLRGMRVKQIFLDDAPSTVGEALRQTATMTEDDLETLINAGQGIVDYKLETGKDCTIKAYQYIDIRITGEYIIEGTGTLTIEGNGFLNVGVQNGKDNFRRTGNT